MKLQFPSQQTIISYLEQHALTNKQVYPYLSDKKIIEAVSAFFSNPDKAAIGVDAGVTLTMCDLQNKLKLSNKPLMFIIKCLKLALIDCAYDNKIELKKNENTISKL